jgi:hypothetical protein
MADEFDAAVAASMKGPPEDPAQAARVGMAGALGTNPDMHAELRRVAQKTGVPISTVEAMPEETKRQAALAGTDFDTLAAISPSTARLLADVDKAKLAHDDVGNLSAIEKAVRSFMDGKPADYRVDGHQRAVTSPEFGALVGEIKAKNPSLGFDEARAMAAQIATVDNSPGGIRPSTGPKPGVGAVLSGVGTSFVSGMEQVRQGLRMQMDDAMGFTSDAPSKYGRASNQIALTTPDFESSTAKGLYGGLVSTVRQAPAIATAIGLGPLAGLGMIGAQTEAQAYGKYKARGASGGQAVTGALAEAAIEVATEALPMSFLVNKLGKAGAGEFIKGLLAREIPSEQLATLAQDAVDTAIANPNKTWGQYAAERPGAAYETLLATLVQSGVMGGAHTVLERTAMKGQAEAYRAQQAEQGAAQLGEIMQFAAANKVRERAPETFHGFMQEMTQDGPLEKVYLNPQELEKAGIDLTQLAEVAPSAAADIEQALKTGTDAAISTAELATLLPGTPLEAVLLQHLKTDPAGFSQAGAQAYVQEHGEAVRQTVEKVLGEKQQDDTFKASMAKVEANVLGQLQAANRFTEDVNAPYAALWSSFFGVMAARTGQMPEALFEQYSPTVAAEGVGALEQQQPVKFPKEIAEEITTRLQIMSTEDEVLGGYEATLEEVEALATKFATGKPVALSQKEAAIVRGELENALEIAKENAEFDPIYRTLVRKLEASLKAIQKGGDTLGQAANPEKQRQIDELRKRESVLKTLRECLGAA